MIETYLFPAFIAIVSALLSAWLSIYWPIWRNNKRYSREVGLLGEWLSSWQEAEDKNKWVLEKVTISVDKGKIVLKNQENDSGYEWEARGEFHDHRYFHGVWKSMKPGSHSSGVFNFIVLPQGDALVGYALGPDKRGNLYSFQWAMGRNSNALAEAKQWSTHKSYPIE